MTDESHYLALAAAYVRGALGRPELMGADDPTVAAEGAAAGLRLGRFKRSAELPRVRRVLGVLRGLGVSRLVDVGSGRGAFLWPLLDQLTGVEVVAVDVMPTRVEMLAAVRRGGVSRLVPARMDGRALALANRAADVVTLLEVLEHMPDAAPAIGEAVRVASTAVVASVPSHADDNPEHLHLFDGRRLAALFTAAGARRVTSEHVLGHIVCVAMVR